jgi:hypothetical protein
MTDLELAELMAKCADDGLEPLKAFTTCTKAGLTSVKRDKFEEKYAELVHSPFMRVMLVRSAREEEFKLKLAAACLQTRPSEDKVTELSLALGRARQDPRNLPACLESFKSLLSENVHDELKAAASALWELTWNTDAK